MGLVSRIIRLFFSLAPMPLSPGNALRNALSVPAGPLFRGSFVVGIGSPLRERFTHLRVLNGVEI